MKAPDAELIAATKNGKGKMPAYDGKLTDAQIKETIAYIRTLQKKLCDSQERSVSVRSSTLKTTLASGMSRPSGYLILCPDGH